MKRKVHVIINPASGREKPILHIINRVFNKADVEWDISLTKVRGDAERFAREAAADPADVCLLGEKTFLQKVGMGFWTRKVDEADCDLKNHFGIGMLCSVSKCTNARSIEYAVIKPG